MLVYNSSSESEHCPLIALLMLTAVIVSLLANCLHVHSRASNQLIQCHCFSVQPLCLGTGHASTTSYTPPPS